MSKSTAEIKSHRTQGFQSRKIEDQPKNEIMTKHAETESPNHLADIAGDEAIAEAAAELKKIEAASEAKHDEIVSPNHLASAEPKKIETKTTETKADKRVGFKLGPVWMSSVKAGKGIALHGNNRKKLEFTAQQLSVEFTPGIGAEQLCKLLAPKITPEMLAK